MPIAAELRDLLALHLVPGLGPRLTAALLERFGTPAAVFRARTEELLQVPHIGEKLAGQIARALAEVDVDKELGLVERHEVALVPRGHPDYPATLATIPTPPTLLYLRGGFQSSDRNAVAVVGSRHCTAYGKRVAERLGADLARAGFTVVSGLARGIDGAAHRGALEAGGRTIAVLAGGLARIYPPEHADLAEQVRARGALVSEAAMAMEPMAGMFPARNRIISGLARAVVVVEANDRSGALITATHAAEQGREVFAVPGPVDSPASAGTLKLLRQGAKLVRHAADVLEDLNGIAPITSPEESPPPPVEPAGPPLGLDEGQLRIWECLAERPRHMDEISRQLGVPIAELTGRLMLLEMKKVIRRLPGNQFERC